MSRPDKTPAASRRFVHPSSSAQPSTSTKKPLPAFSQKPPTSSGFASSRAVRFGTPAVHRDEISASFEEEATPSLPARKLRPPNTPLPDEIDADSLSQNEHDKFRDAHGGGLRRFPDTTHQSNDFATPMPKRRKRNHSHDPAPDPIAISSSPSESGSAGVLTDEEDVPPPKATATPFANSRFRTKLSTPASEEARTRPAFRQQDSTSALPPEMSTTLPDAFTPSRRKGKREYATGGLADTVRSWVLQAATEETQRGGREEREVKIDRAMLDDSRRGILCTDDRALNWMLIGSKPANSSALSLDTVSRLANGAKVSVRGTATSWTVPLRAAGQKQDLQVATHWDIAS